MNFDDQDVGDSDVVILDSVGMPINPNAPMGGSEMQLLLLTVALRDSGVGAVLLRKDRSHRCKTLLVSRYSPLPAQVVADRVIVMAHDLPDERYAQHRGREIVCVSEYQRDAFEEAGYGPCRVIRPVMGDHVKIYSRPALRLEARWIYASAIAKGLEATLRAWGGRRDRELVVTSTGYDEPDPGYCEQRGARWIGQRNPFQLAHEIALSEGMFYRNERPECFPMVVAIARELGLSLDIACIGHDRCGVQEAMQPHDLSPITIAQQWIDLLGGAR